MITQLNDFIFCPRSIYFHDIYRNTTSESVYHQTPQLVGREAHKALDEHHYSTQKQILTGTTVYSEKYGLLGCIDLFDCARGALIERKYSVTAIYDGFKYQLYAQYAALMEMGYQVRSLAIYSKKDNKTYPIPMPGEQEWHAFEAVVEAVRHFRLTDPFEANPAKCQHCIYAALCDKAVVEEG